LKQDAETCVLLVHFPHIWGKCVETVTGASLHYDQGTQ